MGLLPLSWQSLRPMPAQSPITTDIMADILTIGDTGVDTVDTMDTPTDTGSVKHKMHLPLPLKNMPSKNDLLMPMLMPAPNPTTTDTTAIPTDGADTTDTDTDTVTDTGVRFLHHTLCKHMPPLARP